MEGVIKFEVAPLARRRREKPGGSMGTVVGPPTRVSAADRYDDELVTGERSPILTAAPASSFYLGFYM